MRLADVMTAAVETIQPEVPAEQAWQRMRLRSIRHLVVMDGRRVVGLLSDRDAGSSRGQSLRRHRTVEDLMTRHVVTAQPTTTVRQAANLMAGRTIGCLPVVDRNRLVGIVTASDLLRLLGRGMDRGTSRSTRWTLKSRGARGQGTTFRRGLPGG